MRPGAQVPQLEVPDVLARVIERAGRLLSLEPRLRQLLLDTLLNSTYSRRIVVTIPCTLALLQLGLLC